MGFPIEYREIVRRLRVIGVPSVLVPQLANQITTWAQCSGSEWTISRLKLIKQILIHRKAKVDFHPGWIKLGRDKLPKGPFGCLLRWGLSGKEKNFALCVQACNAYTLFVNERLTEPQIRKFISSVKTETKPIYPSNFLFKFQEFVKMKYPRLKIDRTRDNSLVMFRGSPSKRLPKLHEWDKSRPQDRDVLLEASYFQSKTHAALLEEFYDLYKPVLAGLEVGNWTRKEQWHPGSGGLTLTNASSVYGGSIGFIQEPGGKLRYVANPHLVHQLALQPLGDAIYRFVSTLPWDCTFDQSKPFCTLQNHLQRGGFIHSIDLSSATDHFPLDMQYDILCMLFGDSCRDIQLFRVLSRSTWRLPQSLDEDGERVSWTKGQPLGLYPSFGCFTLTHGLLLFYLSNELHHSKNKKVWREDFFVVGDDVVILNQDLYEVYVSLLQNLGCPISWDKTISSCELCEFAGKIVTKTMVIPQLKWRKVSDDNFLDLCRLLGQRSLSLLNRRQRRIAELVQHALPPVGLGFSFENSSLEKQQEITDQLLLRAGEKLKSKRSLVEIRSHLNERFLGRDPAHWVMEPDPKVLSLKESAFDEKVREVFLSALGWVPQPILGYDTLLGALDELNNSSWSKQLPVDFSSNGYKSTLERYEELYL